MDDPLQTGKLVTVFSPANVVRCTAATANIRAVIQTHDQKIRIQQLHAEVGGSYAEWRDIPTVVESFPGQVPSCVPLR